MMGSRIKCTWLAHWVQPQGRAFYFYSGKLCGWRGTFPTGSSTSTSSASVVTCSSFVSFSSRVKVLFSCPEIEEKVWWALLRFLFRNVSLQIRVLDDLPSRPLKWRCPFWSSFLAIAWIRAMLLLGQHVQKLYTGVPREICSVRKRKHEKCPVNKCSLL